MAKKTRAQIELDPTTEEVKDRVSQIRRGAPKPDKKETKEREEAAKAYFNEKEQHYVDYLEDCVQHSVDSSRPVRREQFECWDVYQENEPVSYARKESWQSRVILPAPFGAVQFASAVTRKAFDTQFLSIENEQDQQAEDLWQRLMSLQLNRSHSNFSTKFTDAAGMSFAIGTSMEMIPVWVPNRGLTYVLGDPWKIHRDPDAVSRDPQSGVFWIHQEWIDYYVLKHFQDQGIYENVTSLNALAAASGQAKDPKLSKEELARLKNQVYTKSKFRSSFLTSEFWGTVLSPNGELLLPNATYRVAGGRVIMPPKVSPFQNIRWPGTAFSVLPNLIRFPGRGILHGVRRLWEFMCALMCLHIDHLNWVVNPPVEINVKALVEAADTQWYPGKIYHVRDTVSGQQAIRAVDRKFITGEVLANLNFGAQNFDKGTFVTSLVQGLPGYRAEVTAREAAQSLEQAMTVFSLIGRNLEDGALNAIELGAETIAVNISYPELVAAVGEELALRFRDKRAPTGVKLPFLKHGAFSVSGISALMREWEIVRNIRDVILPLFGEGSVFMPYMKPYALLQSLERRLNLKDEGILIDPAQAQIIDGAQQSQQEAEIADQTAMSAAEAAIAAKSAMATPAEVTPEMPLDMQSEAAG